MEREEEFIVPHFRSRTLVSLEDEDEDHDLNTALQQMLKALESFYIVDRI